MTNEATKLQNLGKNIAKYRNINSYTQNQLAEKVNVGREHIAKIETAKKCVSLKLLFKIAEALNVNEKDLFNFENM